MDRALDSLTSDFKLLVFEGIARATERGIPLLIVQTSRTWAEHNQNLSNGTSWVPLSKHLPRKLRRLVEGTAEDLKSDAIDICPYGLYQIAGPDKLAWDAEFIRKPEVQRAFAILGEIGEQLGFRWGGRWEKKDLGHWEFLLPGERHKDIPPTSAAFAAHGVR